MNQKDYQDIQNKLKHLEDKTKLIHDDVLILKTKWDMTGKFMVLISAGVSLFISVVALFFRG